MAFAPQGGFDAADGHRDIGPELLEDSGIDEGRPVRAGAGATFRRVSVVAAKAFGGSIVVDHGVHGAGAYTEEQPRPAELAEVAQVVAPVGLRHNGDLIPFGLQHTCDDSRAE